MSTPCISITELNQRVATLLERQVPLLWVQGEISNLTRAASGHWYFSLKDANAQVRAVMFRQKNNLLNWQPREGDAVQAQVLAGLYTARGEFQLSVESMRPAGLGTLFERFLRLKDELSAAGWFDAARKKALPSFIKTVGIVTSPQAAALRDVAQTLARRAPHVSLLLYPTLVQGEQAVGQIAQQIAAANKNASLDALLVVRGGGSLEDLWAFNEKIVAQAMRDSHLPIINGVGHETDTTIADFVADVRAATPTAAAELISTPSSDVLNNQVLQQFARLKREMSATLRQYEQQLDRLTLQLMTPTQQLAQHKQHLSQQWLRLQQSLRFMQQNNTHRLAQSAQRLAAPQTAHLSHDLTRRSQQLQQSTQRLLVQNTQNLQRVTQSLMQLNPDNVLARGYVYVRAQNGSIVYNAKSLQSGDGISVQFSDGRAVATVNHIE